MRRNILIIFKIGYFLLFFLLASNLLAKDFQVKSLRVYSSQEQISFPIIDLSDKLKNSITIDFDVDGDNYPTFVIIFKFCDSEWNPYESAFLQDPMYNTERSLWFETLPTTIKGASYHFRGSFPNKNVHFPFSGKWRFYIVSSMDYSRIYGMGRFYVVRPEIKINTGWTKETADISSRINELNRTLAVRTSFSLPDTLFQANVKKVEIINNRKLSDPVIIDRDKFTGDRFFQWNGAKEFTFVARNIKPGNKYRQTDTRNYNVYNTPNVSAKFGNIETSNLFTRLYRDFNGGFELLDFKDPYADYLNVQFKLRTPDDLFAPVFLVGSFTDWEVLPEFEMRNDKGMRYITVELKRGIYDYQYVTGNVIGDKVDNIDWQVLEGNFYETENEFYIFLYYTTIEKGGYDKIIGYKKITTGAL
jgi:hypothetical protein